MAKRNYHTVDFWRLETTLTQQGEEEVEAHYAIECEVWPGFPGSRVDPPEPPTVEIILVKDETGRVRRDIQELIENDPVAMSEIAAEVFTAEDDGAVDVGTFWDDYD